MGDKTISLKLFIYVVNLLMGIVGAIFTLRYLEVAEQIKAGQENTSRIEKEFNAEIRTIDRQISILQNQIENYKPKR